jgi:hypothetical protein
MSLPTFFLKAPLIRQRATALGLPVREIPLREVSLTDLLPHGGEATCPYCDEPGGTESVGTDMLHRACYLKLGNDMALLTGSHPDEYEYANE